MVGGRQTTLTPDQVELPAHAVGFGPTSRMVGEALSWFGGGLVFAATVYLMVALPGLFG